MKPMIKYRGGKSREIPYIIRDIPKFDGRYIEPFFGGGALFFYLEPERSIINDINSKLMAFYKGVRDDYENMSRELDELEAIYARNRKEFDALKAIHPNKRVEDKNEELYYKLRAMFNDAAAKTYSDAVLYYYINKTAYSGMIRYNSNGEFNVPFGRYKCLNTKFVTEAHHKLLQRAEIFNTDYSDIFNMCHPEDFVFLDPPYDCIFSDYGNEEYRGGFSEDNHRRLARDFKDLPCKAMMVIGRTPLTEELYGGYIAGEYEKKYAVNIRNRFKSAARHIIVTNPNTFRHNRGRLIRHQLGSKRSVK
ncbi:MAG: Dam family site-specific DNA-(adenine-N6)-methyltransferase [Opitutae bacterium]|nr:Dam family site-specific DNA-(adenine-N6)-methyltransferase [Opitutae bacterium]MCD8299333.1 Dam family site-specific DNA-(adenine-N6)-methyltransferase [Opitutae bacterium]